jgi:HK97 gp10 family phage protein
MKISVEGTKELAEKLHELASEKEGRAALTEAVRKPMKEVFARAQSNISIVSPGKTEIHRTYKGRLVTSGFASRSLRLQVKYDKRGRAFATIGVLAEAFYALQFFELGTSTIPARPWLVPAFESAKHDTVRKVGEVLKARIERIAKKRAAGK